MFYLHAEVNLTPIFAAFDVYGHFFLFKDTYVTLIMYEDEAVDVDAISSGWCDFS